MFKLRNLYAVAIFQYSNAHSNGCLRTVQRYFQNIFNSVHFNYTSQEIFYTPYTGLVNISNTGVYSGIPFLVLRADLGSPLEKIFRRVAQKFTKLCLQSR